MELRVLEYFVEAAHEENISRAAVKLHVSQPAMSKQIKALEYEIGHTLFNRSNGRIELTDEGRLFLRRAEDILEMVHKTKLEFETLDGSIGGDIYIGCAESDSIKYLARAAKSIQLDHPRIRYHLYSGNVEDLNYRLERGLLDFTATFQRVDITTCDRLTIPTPDVWGVLMRRDAPLAAKDSVTIDDLKNLPLICSREALDNENAMWFGNDFKKLNVAVTYNLLYNAAIMVREGLGYAISLDKLADTSDDSDLCFRPLDPPLTSTLQLIWRKDKLLSSAAQIFLVEMRSRYENK